MSPTPRRQPRSHDRIEIVVPGKGPHPAVVLKVESSTATTTGMIVVAVGSTTPIAATQIITIDRDPALRTMKLRVGCATIFFEEHIHPVVWNGEDYAILGKTPAGVFKKLFAGMERLAADALAGKRTITTIPREDADLVTRMKNFAIAKAAVITPPPGTVAVPSEVVDDERSDATAMPADEQKPSV